MRQTNSRRRIWAILSGVILFTAVCLLFWHNSRERKLNIIRHNVEEAEWRAFESNIARAKLLVRRITAEAGAGRLRGWPEYPVPVQFPESYPVAYPVVVTDEGANGGSDLWGAAGGEDRVYRSNTAGVPDTTGVTVEEARELRWIVLRTYGVFEKHPYGPEGFPGVQSDENRLFIDAWVVDLRNITVVAHRRFVEDPLPFVLGDYYREQRNKLNDEIGSWLAGNVRSSLEYERPLRNTPNDLHRPADSVCSAEHRGAANSCLACLPVAAS